MLKNDGLYWNGRDLRSLHWYARMGYDIPYIAKALGRTESACKDRLRIIRTALLFSHGGAFQTLKDIQI